MGRLIREQGYSGFAARLAATLDLSAAPLEQARLRTLVSIAAEFDRQSAATALQFAAFVQAQQIPAEETGSNIQILTMHKAKGLEYDLVILPALGDKGITSKGKPPLLVHEQAGDAPIPPVDWILSSPAKEIIESEPPLAAQLAATRRSQALEELRLLYVAMTRAKRALHLLVTASPEKPTALRLDDVVRLTLAPDAAPDAEKPVWENGPADWWKQARSGEKPADMPAAPLSPDALPAAPAARPLPAHIASQEHAAAAAKAGRFFRPQGAAARDLGTRVHELFEQIEWLAPGDLPAFPGADSAAARLVAAILQNPDPHRLFEKPAGPVELYREQAFEAILNGRWLSGKIDRLHLERDASGTPLRARVLDYKTDQAPDPARHQSQMNDYRQAVALLFGLPPGQIACTLLFVRGPQVLDL